MQGDPEVLEFLNEQLTAELTAINQYFLHAKMQENFGWTKLAKYTRSESIDEMKHAEVLTDRILFLERLPNYQRLSHVRVGQTVTEMFQADRQIEVESIDRLRRGVEVMRAKGDITSANVFESILADEEKHIDYLDTQLELVEKLGEPLSISPSSSSSRPPSRGAALSPVTDHPASQRAQRPLTRSSRSRGLGRDVSEQRLRLTGVDQLTPGARATAQQRLDAPDAASAVGPGLARPRRSGAGCGRPCPRAHGPAAR